MTAFVPSATLRPLRSSTFVGLGTSTSQCPLKRVYTPRNARLRRREILHPGRARIVASVNSTDIKLFACDMDGTLLTTDKRVSDRNQQAIRRVLFETDVLFVPATGKSRAGALNSMGQLGELLKSRYPNGCPGVYLQGLIVYDLDGTIIYENQVDSELAKKSVALAQQLAVDIIAYSRDAILSDRNTEFTDLLPKYREPEVTVIPNWEQVIGKRTLNKFIMMAHPDKIDEIRPTVESQLETIAHLTQAQPDMLEILPPLSSKGDGVQRLLDHLSVDPENVIAAGDAENDIELLKMVGYSCAMGNALPSVKSVSKYTDFSSNDDDGVAEVVDRFLVRASVGSS